MARRVFISYQHADQLKAQGFNLMSYNKGLDLQFIGRHLLNPVDSNDAGYISRKIREQITNTSVTVVIIGGQTAQSDWVSKEVGWSLAKDPPNGIVGIRLSPEADIPSELEDCGAEILDWFQPDDVHEFRDAIERAAMGARRTINMPTNSIGTCSR